MDNDNVASGQRAGLPQMKPDTHAADVEANQSPESRKQITAAVHRRYRDYLAGEFGRQGVENADTLAEIAVDALTDWRNVDTGARCRCSCHPQLPTADRHDYGFDCTCTKTRDERKRTFDELCSSIDAFWQSPEGKRITADKRAEAADLREWLATQADVTARSDGEFVPEVWSGEVAGHRFYFRERGGDWRIELDLRPTGRYVPTVVAVAASGEPRIEQREVEVGDVIADGGIADDGYGTTPRERVQFIVGQIRQHLARTACAVHDGDLSTIESALGAKVLWCPACGTPLAV